MEDDESRADRQVAPERSEESQPRDQVTHDAVQFQRVSKRRSQGLWLRLATALARIVLVLVFAVGFFCSVIPLGRAVTRSVYVLPAIITASQPGAVSVAEEPIQHVTKTIESSNGPVYLDVYEPAQPPPALPGKREGVVVIPGVGDNRGEPQLINFADSFARAGVVVMDITTPTLIAYDLSRQDSDAVVQAVKALERWPGVGADRIGIIGFSAGDALACFAAADPRIRDKLAFIALFGGYFNTISLLRDFGRRALLVDGKLQSWQPQYVPIHVLSSTIEPLLPAEEGSRLVNALAPGGTPLSPDELATFSPDTVAVYHVLLGDEPGQVDANIASLSPRIRTLLDTLSPNSVIQDIRAPIYLLHDRSDQFVPFTETRDFAAALAGIHHPYDFAEIGIFAHVEVKPGLNLSQLLGDGLTLLRFLSKAMLPSA